MVTDAEDIVPSADDTYDLGAVGSEWRDLYIDGTANISDSTPSFLAKSRAS